MKITASSDLHGRIKYPALKNIKPCDVFIIAGDIFSNYSYESHIDARKQFTKLEKFNKIITEIPAKHVIVVAGNHDWVFEYQKQRYLNLNFIYLQDDGIEIDGIHFWGTPWQPEFCNWAFNLPREGDKIKEYFSMIPDKTNILITHSPPFGILDQTIFKEQVGSKILLDKIKKLPNLKAHIFGHIHESYGEVIKNGIRFLNASICNEKYQPIRKMHHFEV